MILPSKSDTTHIETHFDTTGRAEADAFISEIEADGTRASEVLAEIAVKADSANQSSGELAGRVKSLEEALGSGRVLAVDTPAQLSAMDRKAKVGDYILVASTFELHKKVS